MRPVFGAQVLIFILFFIEIEASGMMSNIFTGKKFTKKEKNSFDALATSRLTTSSASKHNPTSIEHEALDLHEYRPPILDTSENEISFSGRENIDWFIENYLHGADAAEASTKKKSSKKSRGKNAVPDLNVGMIQDDQIRQQEQQQSEQEASGKKERSKKSKGKNAVLDLNVPINEKKASKNKVQDLIVVPFKKSAKSVKEAYKIRHAPINVGAPDKMIPFEDKQTLTEDKMMRERESFKHFESFYKNCAPPSPPRPVIHSRGFGNHEYAASSFPPNPEGQLGGYGTYGYAAPTLHQNSDGRFGGPENYGYAATPLHQNSDGRFGGPEYYGYAAPSFHQNPDGSFEGPESYGYPPHSSGSGPAYGN